MSLSIGWGQALVIECMAGEGAVRAMTDLSKIISGGQTGVDRGALDAALELGFPCGGWAPEHGMAEDGEIPGRYPLTRMVRGGYRRRTVQNILDSDGTAILYCGVIEGGTELTLDQCIRKKKPYRLIDGREVAVERAAELLAEFVVGDNIAVLNVAGPRASKWPRAHEYARSVIRGLIVDSHNGG